MKLDSPIGMTLLLVITMAGRERIAFHRTVAKIAEIRRMCNEAGVNPWLEVDGGVTPDNAYEVIEAGANAIVAGSAVFKAPSYVGAIEGIKASKRPSPVSV